MTVLLVPSTEIACPERTVDVMSTALLAAVAVILCILFRILNVNSQPQKPVLYCKDLNFLETILKIAPLLHEPYVNTPKFINDEPSYRKFVR